jgi:mxaJ protein
MWRIREFESGPRAMPALIGAMLLAVAGAAVAQPATPFDERDHGGPPEKRGVLRVCADPNNLPFSHRNGEGFENRLAEIVAEELELPVEYTWIPHRAGFLRVTLRNWLPEEHRYRCDMVMGMPMESRGLSTTRSYYRSTYVLVYPAGRGWDDIQSAAALLALAPDRSSKLRVAIFDQSPAAAWMHRHGLMQNAVPYVLSSADPDFYPGKVIMDDMLEGKVDMAFVWGPIAGYFAKLSPEDLVVVPVPSEHQVRFDYPISIAVRPGDHELLRPLQLALRKRQDEVRQLLVDYNIPMLDGDGQLIGQLER